MKTISSLRHSLSSVLFLAIAATAVPVTAQAQEPVAVSITLTRTTPRGNPPSAITIDAPGNGWDFSAAAPVAGTTWNRVNVPTQTPTATGTYTEDAPFNFNSLNNAQLFSSSGPLSPVRLTASLIGTHTGRAELTDASVGEALAPKALLDAYWRVFDGNAYMRFTFTGLSPSTHYLLYVYASTLNQGGKYILHPSNFPAGKASTFIYPGLTGDENKTAFVDLAGHAGSCTLFRIVDGKTTIIPAARTNTAAVSGSNTMWGALHAVSTSSGQLVFRTDTSALGNRRQYAGFQLIPYPDPTIIEQPDSETVGVLDQITEFFAVARDLPNLQDADQNPLVYQWQVSKDNGTTWTDIPDADPEAPGVHLGTSIIRDPALPEDPNVTPEPAKKITNVLTINGTQQADAGQYRLKVTNMAGRVAFSTASTLSVIGQPAPFVITQQPLPANVEVGNNVSLTTSVSGTPPFTFVWQKSDTANFASFTTVKTGTRGPATSDTLTFPFVRRSDLGYYRAVITDVTRRNPIYSNVVYLYVEYAPPIITPSGPQTVVPGGTISLFGNIYSEIPVTAYQWQVSRDNGATWTNVTNGGAYAGATTETVHISGAGAAQAGLYRLVATNALGTTTGGSVSLAVAAPLVGHPVSVAADDAGHLYVTDDTANTVYQLNLGSRSAVLFAGQSGVAGSADGFYGQATFNAPTGATAGAANTVFLADSFNATIRYLQANGSVGTSAGSTTVRNNIDGTGAAAAFNSPKSVGIDAAGNLYVTDNVAHTVRRITPLTFDVTTLAGSAGNPGSINSTTTNSDYNTATRFNTPGAIAVSPVNFSTTGVATFETPTTTATTIYVADTGNNVIRRIALAWYLDRNPITNVQTRTRLSSNAVTTFAGLAGASGSTDGAALDARFNAPAGLAVDDTGAIYVADTGNHTIRKIVISTVNNAVVATVTTIGGLPGVSGYQDGPTAITSLFNQPRAVTVDASRNVYVADTGNAAVRKIAPNGAVSTLVFTRGTDPVPPTNPPDSGSPVPAIPPAGSGDRGGDLGGGGAPSHWFLGALALLTLLRSRPQIMKFKNFFSLLFVAVLGGALATVPAARAQNPAVFVNLSTVQATAVGQIPATAATFTIAAPGSGWAYGAAAPYTGETWNNILAPHNDDRVIPTVKGYVRYDVVPLVTANNIALAQPDGSASGVTLTASAVLNDSGTNTNNREVPRLVGPSGSTPAALLNSTWRIFEGGNLLRFSFSGLPVAANYLVYGYATTNGVNQGAKFTLADANSLVLPAVWFDTNPAANAAPSIFVNTAGVIAPVAPAPLQVLSNAAGGANAGTIWGRFHAKVDSTGKIVIDVGRNANNNGYPNGFQLIPYPKVTFAVQPPVSLTGAAGGSLTVAVTAAGFDGNDVLTYQWRKDGAAINIVTNPSAATASLSLTGLIAANAGSYDVVVTNLGGSAISTATAVSVQSLAVAPVITTQPAVTQAVLAGVSVSFTAAASGTPAPAYQWYKEATPISGATNATYTIASPQISDAGSYSVVATNTAGSAASNNSVLTVRDPAGAAIVADGFATGVTGGTGGATYVVTTAADLNARLQLTTPAIIIVSGAIDARTLSAKRIDVKSNKTLQGADANATIIGTVNIDGVQNVIIRGLNITNPGTTLENGTGPRYSDGGDGISIRNSSGVLVTHCTFYDCADGMCDLTYDVANATVSWCKFYYTTAQTSHRFTMILGNEATVVPITATLHHNWWSDRCDQRMPGSSNARGHMFNNYFTCAGNSYSSNARDNSQLFIEHSYYGTGVADPVGKSTGTTALIRTIGNIYNGTSGTQDPGTDRVFTPTYSYLLNPAASVPTVVSTSAGNTGGAYSVTPAGVTPITVLGAPAEVYVGDAVTLTASVSSGTSFQWRFNNVEIAGATSGTLALSNIQSSQLGIYTVVVGSGGNFTVSAPATLVAGPAPVIPGISGGAAPVVAGKDISIRLIVSGQGVSYQWQRSVDGAWVDLANGSGYEGTKTNTLVVRNAATAQAGEYRLVATNSSGSATSASYLLAVLPSLFPNPTGIAVDAFGTLYVADSALNVVRSVLPNGAAKLHAGLPNTAGSLDGAFGKSTLNAPGALAIDAFGNLYVADAGNATVRAVSRDGTLATLAGAPNQRGSRDGIGSAALFASPSGLSFDRTSGVTYLADTNNHTVRRLTPQGLQAGLFVGNVVATISGSAAQSGDTDVAAVTLPLPPGTPRPEVALARYNHPAAVAFAGSFLYVADTGNNTIRRISLAAGDNQFTTATLAGTPGVTGSDDGTGLMALFNQPQALVADAAGSVLYVADTGNNAIRRVTSAGVVTTLAGLPGIGGLADGVGDAALFNRPTALALDVAGTALYVADTGNAAIRKIVLSGNTATVTTVAVSSADDLVPPPSSGGSATPFVPTGDSAGEGGGGSPSIWFLTALATLALVRSRRESVR